MVSEPDKILLARRHEVELPDNVIGVLMVVGGILRADDGQPPFCRIIHGALKFGNRYRDDPHLNKRPIVEVIGGRAEVRGGHNDSHAS